MRPSLIKDNDFNFSIELKMMSAFRPGGWQVLPTVVKNLIIINSILAFAQFVLLKFGIDLSDILGLHYWNSSLFKPWQFITHMFMHGSPYDVELTIMHLFSNMFALWIFGSTLENIWGPKRFLTFYFICGFGAALCHMAVVGYQYQIIEGAFHAFENNPTLDQFNLFLQQHVHKAIPQTESLLQLQQQWSLIPSEGMYSRQAIQEIHQYLYGVNIPEGGGFLQGVLDEATVGASGAVFGVLFAFGYLFPNTHLYIYFLFPIKAKYFVAMYAIFELVAGIRNSAGDNVAHFAHLGGMLFAFILLKIWRMRSNKYLS